MKKRRIIVLTLAVLLILASCGKAGEPTVAPTGATESTEALPPVWAEDPAAYLREDFPVIDGSTSLIPLEAGVRADIFGISVDEATEQVVHSSTWGSFYNLLNGTCDVIFTCPLSEEQRQMAEERGIALECVPVAKEGFIFVVNGDNPVEELTQDELRGIYSGDITNWSDVGGPDSPIIAYQRNNESGSQNYMIEFMGDTPLTDAPGELRPTDMAGILDVLSANDNAINSIGYSVYAYAADMYGDGDDIKFIAVDGVPPTKQTMAAGEYPLMGINYAVFRGDESADSNVRALIEYMTSYDGQLAAAGAGYITLEDIGYNYTEMALERYSGTGSGGRDPEAEAELYYAATRDGHIDLLNGEKELTCLADKELEAEVNAAIAEGIKEIGGWHQIYAYAKNGYLSLEITRLVHATGDPYESRDLSYENTVSAVWDMYTGRRLTVEELFFDGVDIDAVLNAYLTRASQLPYEIDHLTAWYYEMKRDFAALPLYEWSISAEAIYIHEANPFFKYGVRIPLSDLPSGNAVWEVPRDMAGLFEGENVSVEKTSIEKSEIYYELIGDTFSALLREECFPAAEKINEQVREYILAHYTSAAIAEYFGYEAEELYSEAFYGGWQLSYTDRYAVFSKGLLVIGGMPQKDGEVYPFPPALVFDLKSGERVDWRETLKDGWEQAAYDTAAGAPWQPVDVSADDWHMIIMTSGEDGFTVQLFSDEDIIGLYTLELPYEYMN